MAGEVRITGMEEALATLRGLPDKLRRRALRNALSAGARIVRDEAGLRTPVLKTSTYSGASALRRGVRKVGTVKKSISVRTSKLSRREGNVGVFVNVRPSKITSRGAKNPDDNFYWRWLNWGWNPAGGARSKADRKERRRLNKTGAEKRKPGAKFLEAGAKKLGAALDAFKRVIGVELQKLNNGGKI